MLDGEWVLRYPGTELVFGPASKQIFNRTTPDFGDTEIRVADQDRPRADGRNFGMDFRGGRTIAFDLGLRGDTPAAARDLAAQLALAWRADAVRQAGGSVAELVFRYDGRERAVYGRPRRFSPNYSDVAVNRLVTVQADFVCGDDLYYGTELETARMSMMPVLGGGLLAPLKAPLTTTASSDRSAAINVTTELPAWPVITVHGPIINPLVEIVGVFKVEVRDTVAADETLVIDTRPWMRTALKNGTASVAGAVRGARLAQLGVPSGTHQIVLRGLDVTGTARADIQWGATYPTP